MTRPRKKLLFAFGSFLALIVAYLAFEHFRGSWMLKRWQARMAAKGEALNIDQLAPVPPTSDENGMPQLMWTAGQLGNFPSELNPPVARYIVPGKWPVVTGINEWYGRRQKYTNVAIAWARVAEPLALAEPNIQDALEALHYEHFHVNVYYRGGFNIALNHLTRIRALAQFLAVAALHDLHQRQNDAAFAKLQGLLALIDAQREEPLIISQLVRISAMYIALSATWQALQCDGWSDEQLARLQQAWAKFDFLSTMDKAFCMERAMVVWEYDRCRDSDVPLSEIFDPSGTFVPAPTPSLLSWDWVGKMFDIRDRVYTPLWKFAWSRQDELYYCETTQAILKAHRDRAAFPCGAKAMGAIAGVDSAIMGPYDRIRFVMAPLVVSAIGSSLRKAWMAQASAEIVTTAIALKRYQLRHGQVPWSLAQLVPEFLSRQPTDYMDGKPLRYCVDSETTFVVYSIGADGRDDGGDATANGTANFQNTHDLVWPQPASEIETEIWRAMRR